MLKKAFALILSMTMATQLFTLPVKADGEYDYDVTKNVLFGLNPSKENIVLSRWNMGQMSWHRSCLIDGKSTSASGWESGGNVWFCNTEAVITTATFNLPEEHCVDAMEITSGDQNGTDILYNFHLEYWNGYDFVKAEGSEVTENPNKVRRQEFPVIKSSKFRLVINDTRFRIREVSLERSDVEPEPTPTPDVTPTPTPTPRDDDVIPDGYDYNINKNVLFGSDVSVNQGDCPLPASLADGKRESVDGNKDTKWFVQSPSGEDWAEFILKKEATVAKAVIYSFGSQDQDVIDSGCFQVYANNEWKNIEGSEFSENSQRMIEVTFNPVRGKQFRFLTNTTKRFRIVEIQLESPERKMNFENTKNGSVYAPGTVNDIFYAEDTGDCEVNLYIDSKELVYEKTEEDKYSFSTVVDKIGEHTLRAEVIKDGMVWNEYSVTFTVSNVDALFALITGEQDKEKIDSLLINMADDFALYNKDISYYKDMSKSVRDKLIDELLKDTSYTKDNLIEKLYENIKASEMIAYINGAENASDMETAIKLADSKNSGFSEDFSLLPDAAKQEISDMIVSIRKNNGDFSDGEKLMQMLPSLQAIYVYENTYALSLPGVFERYKDVAEVDTSYIEKGIYDDVLERLKEKSVSDYGDIPTLLEEAYDEVKKENKKGSGGGGGGGGGGSSKPTGGGSGYVYTAPTQQEKEEESFDINNEFSDLAGYAWAEKAIERLYREKIISGKAEGEFCPSDLVKREEFVKMVICALDFEEGEGKLEFDDVPEDSWAYPYILSAVNKGIVSGKTQNTFGMGDYITREQIAVILARAATLKGAELTAPSDEEFSDEADISDYALISVKIMKASGIISGYEDNTFKAKNNATRAEAAVMIARLLELI